MSEPLAPAYEAEIREHVAAMSNYTLGNLFARDLLAEVDRLLADRAKVRTETLNEVVETLAAKRRRVEDADGMELAEELVRGLVAEVEQQQVVASVAKLRRTLAPAPPVPDNTGDEGELDRLRELERRVTEQLEDFEEGLEEDPGAPAVARNMTELLARAVRGESR